MRVLLSHRRLLRSILADNLGLLALALVGLSGCNPPSPKTSPASAPPVPPASSPVRFADVAEKVGISYRWQVTGKRPLNILQTIGNGCAFLDYNNDGNLDILLVGPKLALYKGDGKGHFTDVTHQAGLDMLSGHFLGCAVGDYDNDGYEDIYLTAYRGGVLLHNEPIDSRHPAPDSTRTMRMFIDVTASSGLAPQPFGSSAAFGDLDGDGKLDLFIGNYIQFGPDTVPQMCTINNHLTACSPTAYKPEHGTLYRNLGNGRFADVTKAWGADKTSGKALGAAFADYDGSGHQSLALANDEVAGDLLKNQGNRFENAGATANTAFASSGKPYAGMGIDWGDYNNDGRLDMAIATFALEAKPIFTGMEGGFFDERSLALGMVDPAAPYVSFGIKWLDCDNDGWLDLVIANGHISDNVADYDPGRTYREPTLLFHNENGTHFTEIAAATGTDLKRPIVGRGLAIGDYDNDGRIDILVVDSEGAPLLLHNETSGSGHWLSLRLIGTKSNRDGIGAQVTIEAGGRKLLRLCHTDGSYFSASDRRVHIGLGSATTANLTVRWPDGHTDTVQGVAADHVITLREGDTQVQVVPSQP